MLREAYTPPEFVISPGETCLTATMETARRQPDAPMFTRPKDYEWVTVTSSEFIDEVFSVAKGLVACGVGQGDRVALMSNTRYEWNLLDFAIWAAGAVVVPIYPSSSMSQVRWIIEDSQAVVAITETREHSELVDLFVCDSDGVPALKESSSQVSRLLEINSAAVDTLKFEGRAVEDSVIDDRIAATASDDLASLVYTSGTTGRPKGCMITHRNWLAQVRGLLTNPIGAIARPGKRVLTFLPLAHVLSHAVSVASMVGGALQNHWSDFSTLPLEFQRSQPHLILGVPRVFEKVRNGAHAKAHEAGLIAGSLFDRAENVAIAYSHALDTEDGPSAALKAQHMLYDKLVYQKLRDAMGGEVAYCITGGSAMSLDLLHFFRGAGVPVYEGYGLTETCAAACVDFADHRIGTVGPPLGGVSIRANADGELQIKGDIVFSGYWNNSDATAEAFDGPWYNTGDLGEVLESGHIKVTGRKKDIIVTAGGKNVSPSAMEDELRSHPLVSQALVVGDGKPFISVLLALDPDAVSRWKKQHDIPESRDIAELAHDASLRAELLDAINAVNAKVSRAEAIKKFHILDTDLSEANNEITPTMKVKRNVVIGRYSEEIEQMYQR